MNLNLTRLSLFAHITAIEEDLRDIAEGILGDSGDVAAVLGEQLSNDSSARYIRSEGTPTRPFVVSDLLQFTDFADAISILNRNSSKLPQAIYDELTSMTVALQKLAPIRNKVCHGRPIDYDETIFVFDLCDELRGQKKFPWQRLRKTVEKLRENPSLALDYRIPEYISKKETVFHNLPQPEFDETGYVGRKVQLLELKNLCLGTYPVITVVAEGGAGKTSAILKVAYDILDSPDCPFDAIIWSSSRTSQLTATEIQKIEGAISDSLGMFREVAGNIGAISGEDPVDEVLRYLTEFRILLILDNLETVLDQRIRGFLERLPKGSKVLISSRIGIGAYEYPYKLKQFDAKDSLQLLRILIRTRQLRGLDKIPSNTLLEYCDRMGNNPGFIKWFAAAIQAGRRPEEILASPTLFLQFCLSNVYQYISEDSKTLLRVIQIFSRPLSQAEISYLSDFDAVRFQRSLQQLLTTNMVVMASSPISGGGFETEYEITEMAQKYLNVNHPVPVAIYKNVRRRHKEIDDASAEVSKRSQHNRYAMDSIVLRSSRDAIVGKLLLDALACSNRGDVLKAEELIGRAKSLSADYFEVYKMEALIASSVQKYTLARSAYLTAIEVEPRSAPLRLFYAGFLLRYLQDVDSAIEQLSIAEQLDPTAFPIQLEMARCYYTSQKNLEAEAILLKLVSASGMILNEQRKMSHLLLQIYQNSADKTEDPLEGLVWLEKLRAYFKSLPYITIDDRIRGTVRYAGFVVHRIEKKLRRTSTSSAALDQVRDLKEWIIAETQEVSGYASAAGAHDEAHGVIVRFFSNRDFGFIRADTGEEYFFYRGYVSVGYEEVAFGAKVSFVVGSNKSGSCAIDIKLI